MNDRTPDATRRQLSLPPLALTDTGTARGIEISFQLGGQQHAHRFEGGSVTIGRRADCDLVIVDSSVSRHHATVAQEEAGWVIRDNGSVNGIEFDGNMVQSHTLCDGDELVLGNILISVKVDGAPSRRLPNDVTHDLTSSIQMGDFRTLVESTLQQTPTQSNTIVDQSTPPLTPAAILSMLKDAVDALITQHTLGDVLERVLDLVFANLPVNRAHVLMVEADTGHLVPMVQRAAPGMPDGRMQISRKIAREAVESKKAVLVFDAEEDTRFSLSASIVSLGIRSAMCAPLIHEDRVIGLIYVDRRARNIFSKTHLGILSILASLSAAAVERTSLQSRIEQERKIRERLARYNAPAIVERIIRADDGEAAGMVADEREVTVLFADVAKFTTLSENLPAREITGLLNTLFEALTEEVFKEGGTLDKFMGDAVMVFFGAPLAQPDHAERAVRVALAMQRRIDELNRAHPDRPQLAIRIGINTGTAVVGDVGARQRRDYTVIGDTVNTACRIESSVAAIGQVVIGPETHRLVAQHFDCTPLPAVTLKGKANAIEPFLVRGAKA
ncbi:MAG: FHA domain-containing protein [Planctomycetes bacterium]|nr:FHA domain-containing protein [Planctomycetota bacterium]MCB9870626.1 FHA domain-containing protein [Planctomycetota bacterium]